MKRYGVSKNFKFTLTIFIIGCILVIPALISMISLGHVKPLTASAVNHLHTGQYLSCEVGEYFVLPVSVNGVFTGEYTGVLDVVTSQATGTNRDYLVYFANVNDQRYVRIGAYSSSLRSKLSSFEKGLGGPVSFIGKIAYRKDNVFAMQFIRNWAGFDMEKYVPDYYVLEIDTHNEFRNNSLRILFGVLCFIVSGIFLARGFGIYPLIVRPFEETKEYVELSKMTHYALQDELDQKKRLLEVLRKRQGSLGKWSVLGILLLFAGIVTLIEYKNLWVLQNHFSLLGFFLILGGLEMLWHGFIHSDSKLALWFADRYTLETYAVRIKKTEILIGVLDHRIQEERRKHDQTQDSGKARRKV